MLSLFLFRDLFRKYQAVGEVPKSGGTGNLLDLENELVTIQEVSVGNVYTWLYTCTAAIGYGQPLISQYINHRKLATLRPCINFQNLPPLQLIILLGHFDHFSLKRDMNIGSSPKFLELGPFLRDML